MIAIGSGLIATNPAIKTILVIGVDMIHRLTDSNDPGCFLWSDGAGAAVLEGGNLQGFIGAGLQGRRRLCIRLGHCSRSHLRAGERGRREGRRTQMREKGNYPATVNEDGWPSLFKRIAAEKGFTANDVDQLLFTQISKPSIAIAGER